MEKEEVLMAYNGSLESNKDIASVHINGVLKDNENPDVGFLEDLDSYWDDINDRLTISRAVSDSIVRGMVTAIESEAAEKIVQKDLELSRIRETLITYHVGSEENESSEAYLDHQDGTLNVLKVKARKQLMMLVQELTNLRKYIHVGGGGGGVVGDSLGEISSKTVDKMLDSLKSILETVLKRKNETEIPYSWHEEHDFRKEIEFAVVTSFVRSLKDEYQQRLLEQEAEFGDKKSLLLGNMKEITGLRHELEAIRKSLLDHENGDMEAGEEGDRKRVEKLHRKMSGSLSTASYVSHTNGKHDERSVGSIPENPDALNHLTRDDLISHFKTEMNKMKRDHDYEIQEMTEKCFTYKRNYLNLKERGSFSFVGKDKEFEALKKKIPFVILKLDKILLEDEKVVCDGKNNGGFKTRLDSLLLENRKLKNSLSDASEKISQLSQAEANHQKLIRKLESDVDDCHVEASICEDVYRCFVTEFVGQIKCAKQETDLEHTMLRKAYEGLLEDIASKDNCETKDDFVDSYVESFMTEECSAVIYKEALKEADKKIVELNIHVTENEEALRLELVDKERLTEEIHSMQCLVKEKEVLVQVAENNLNTERDKLEVVSQQINDTKSWIEQQQTEIQEKDEALRLVSGREIQKIEGYERKISGLTQELELIRENVKKNKEEKRKTEEKLSATEAEEKKLKKQLLSLDLVPRELMQGFNILEGLVEEKSQKTNSRLKSMHSQLCYLSHQIDELKGKASMYKQRFHKKCCDLQKAEAEVDLLGDEVESLLDLLKKIYIALDHYSPVLKHYPGITEILKLVRRELSGESKRPTGC